MALATNTTTATTTVAALTTSQRGLDVRLSDGRNTTLSWRWVRDHGEDPASFNHKTRQRQIDVVLGAEPLPADEVSQRAVEGLPVIALNWPEAPHATWISESTIVTLMSERSASTAQLWSSPEEVSLSWGEVDRVLVDDGALTGWLSDLSRFGVAALRGFVGGHDAVVDLTNRIGYPRSTIFGATWDLASDIDAHDDTAYGESFLEPHTDGTYSHDAPGLQMFCCIERSGTGGESTVVDGFAIAADLRRHHPDDFELLTRVSVPAHYIEAGVELRASRPAIRLGHDGQVVQVSLNHYDRSPMLLPHAEMDAFYRAYRRLRELANDPARWLSIRLEPGDVLINDNWRVLHGRNAYSGARRFIGCYLNREDFESRCRTLGVPTP